ncbi:porin [Bradyrhizobium valentinum]|uniref:Porin n=1 Tax=Bradyrhizobium valentinum TaxID=1518501 RepID=A0A0R3L7E1_9BRAD|nr:porin [Bradyrhizobium valentinum]KRR03848.1 polymerase [Bradyrhizobium valentinum]KRR12429.1 polymerase [Bradyrhizobium valentinum]
MNMIKGLILGSAAGLIAVSGAQAADLPVKAKAVEYVKICSLYGAGFYYIPGSDTCMKIGGYVRVDTTFNGGIFHQPAWNANLGQQNRVRDYYAARSRLALSVDTRTATAYGVVRSFAQANFNLNSSTGEGYGTPGAVAGSTIAAGSQSLGVDLVFIQFAGFTFGKSASAFATPWQGYPGNNSSHLIGGHDDVTGTNNIQYTAQFGNGVSGTIGLDDPYYGRTSLLNLGVANPATAITAGNQAYSGAHAPDIVGNIRVDQAWGLFQISGALHEVTPSYNLLTAGAVNPLSEISGHPDSKWGGSVMAALQLKNLPTGPGDDIKVDVTYAKGNTRNVIFNSASFAMFGDTGRADSYQSIGFGQTADGVYLPGGDIKLVEAYGIRGAFNHNWDPYWSSSLFGSYSAVRYGGSNTDLTTAKGQWCSNYNAGRVVSADYSCNPDFNVSQLGVVTRWTPVANLTFSAEVMWFHLDQKFSGAANLGPSAPKPATRYEYKDQDAVSLNVRVQRNF